MFFGIEGFRLSTEDIARFDLPESLANHVIVAFAVNPDNEEHIKWMVDSTKDSDAIDSSSDEESREKYRLEREFMASRGSDKELLETWHKRDEDMIRARRPLRDELIKRLCDLNNYVEKAGGTFSDVDD